MTGDGDRDPQGPSAKDSPKHEPARPISTPTPAEPVRLVQGSIVGGVGASSQSKVGDKTRMGDLLVKHGDISQDTLEKALGIQEERGGQLGRILVTMGAASEGAIARALLHQIKARRKRGGEDTSAAARENPDVAGIRVLTRPVLTSLTMVGIDIFSLMASAGAGMIVHRIVRGEQHYAELYVVGPIMVLCMAVYGFMQLYSPIAQSTPDELRIITLSTTLVHIAFGAMALTGNLPVTRWGYYERFAWWGTSLFLVPVIRALARSYLARFPWWGIPVIVLGAAKTGRLVVRTLKAQPRNGIKPIALLDDDPAKQGTLRASFTNEMVDLRSMSISASHFMTESTRQALADELLGPDSTETSVSAAITTPMPPPPSRDSGNLRLSTFFPRGKFAEVEGVPVIGDLALAPVLAERLKVPYAIVAMPGVDSHKLLGIVERVGGKFSHLLVIPDLFGFATLGVPAKSLGGILGVEVRQQLLLPWPRFLKRVIDVALTSVGSLFVLPFLVLIALFIKLDSRGPVFYYQRRLGRDGEHFMAYKFRTMHGDGEARLRAVLEADPALRAEYEIYHKLRKDPRITRFGRFLRKFSLDEFPQLLNVIIGDMSLVGPRPYIERELPDMQGQEKIILRATPGMTGMWQVSDRSAATFAWRVQVDVHYVRNWSPWLDMYILAKTIGVVLKGSGV
jgi:lipopolysaccharide/colanic/teichoic acid biosynthesis glycosyltransferase